MCQVGAGKTSVSESLLTCRNKDSWHRNRGDDSRSGMGPGGCALTGQAVSGMEAT